MSYTGKYGILISDFFLPLQHDVLLGDNRETRQHCLTTTAKQSLRPVCIRNIQLLSLQTCLGLDRERFTCTVVDTKRRVFLVLFILVIRRNIGFVSQ